MTHKRLMALAVLGFVAVIAVAHFRYDLFTATALSSVCSATTTGDLGMDLMTISGFHRLPEGISFSFTHDVDKEGHQMSTVIYRDRAYDVRMRKDRRGVCFDFAPPLPLERSHRTIGSDVASLQSGLTDFFFERWPYAIGLAAIAIWLVALAKRNQRMSAETNDESAPALADSLPDLADELRVLLKGQGEDELADQVTGLQIVDRCRCQDDFCATFYVLPKPHGSYGSEHRNVALSPEKGMLILVVNERIAGIEVLYRDEVRQKLQSLLPDTPAA